MGYVPGKSPLFMTGSKGYPAEQEIETHASRRSAGSRRRFLSEAALGFHFCFGTFGGWPRFAPTDLGRAVELINAAVKATGRQVDWVYIPTLDRTDDEFYAPLANLDVGDARVYLGLIHSMDSFRNNGRRWRGNICWISALSCLLWLR